MQSSYNFWRGDHVRLRAIEQRDLEAALQSADEPDTELDRYEDHIRFPVSHEQDRATLAALAQRERSDDTYFWMIETIDGQHVGYINTFDCDRRVGSFKYAVMTKRPFWHHGYAREAIQLVLRYYFRELRYQKVTVLVYSFNERSMRLHQGLGFSFEGRLRRMVYTHGRHYDELYFGMTREEFDQQDPPLGVPDELPE